jgi:hypothetical protein
MQVRTVVCYLVGGRQAILDIACDRSALALGLVLVLSAGLAREYDGADLVHEPWHLLFPFVASLVSSFILFSVTFVIAKAKRMEAPPFLTSYRMFLSLFWMTAPLAWLYAVPYERFLSPVDATAANLWTLGIVAAWRVALMIRVISVLMGYRLVAAFALVMALADIEALFALAASPIPIIEVMGGIQGSASEMLRKHLAQEVFFDGMCSLPVWTIGAFIAAALSRPHWQASAEVKSRSWSWPVRVLACASVVIWFIFLPFTQPEQLLRHRVELMFAEDQIAEALSEMSAHRPSDFPPQWDPPPRLSLKLKHPPLLNVFTVIIDHPPAPWVRTIYLEKLENYLHSDFGMFFETEHAVQILARLPEGKALIEKLPSESKLRDAWNLEMKKQEQTEGAASPATGSATPATRRRISNDQK